MFGVGVWDDCGASRSFQCMKGVWHSEFRDRMETDLFLNGKGKLEGAPVVTRALEGPAPWVCVWGCVPERGEGWGVVLARAGNGDVVQVLLPSAALAGRVGRTHSSAALPGSPRGEPEFLL